MNRKFCPRERSVGKLSVYGLAFLFVIIGNNLAEGVGTFDGLADTSSLETLGGRLYT